MSQDTYYPAYLIEAFLKYLEDVLEQSLEEVGGSVVDCDCYVHIRQWDWCGDGTILPVILCDTHSLDNLPTTVRHVRVSAGPCPRLQCRAAYGRAAGSQNGLVNL